MWLVRCFFFAVCLPGLVSQVAAEELRGWVDYETVYRLSPGVKGRVASVAVGEGDRVLAGTRLVSLDPTRYEASVRAARSRVGLIEAELEEVVRAFDRDQELYDEGSLSAVALEQRRIARLQTEAQLRQAESDLAAAESALALSYVDAPTDGIVVVMGLGVGEVVVPGESQPREIVFAGSAKLVRLVVNAEQPLTSPLGSQVSMTIGGSSVAGVVTGFDSVSIPGKLRVTIRAEGELPAVGTAVTLEP